MNPMADFWKRRRRAYRKENGRYWRDVVRSGFFTLMFAVLIAGIYLYARALQTLPADFPYRWIVIPVVFAALSAGRVRTMLKGADRVFLLPAEAGMDAYFRGSMKRSLTVQALVLLVSVMAVWPLYRHYAGDGSLPFLWTVILLLLGKWANLLGSWEESRVIRPSARNLLQIARVLLGGISVTILFTAGLLEGTITLLAGTLALAFILSRMKKRRVNWEYLIEREESQLSRVYLFLSWFTDVPQLEGKVKRRALLSNIVRFLPFGQPSAFLYLYTQTFLRRDLFTIATRLTIVSTLFLYLFAADAARVVIFALTVLCTGVQLSALEQAHRYSPWLHLYPLSPDRRTKAVARIVCVGMTVQCAVMGVLLLLFGAAGRLVFPLMLIGIAYAFFYSFVMLKRKYRKQLLQFE